MNITINKNDSSFSFYTEKEAFSGVKKIADKVRKDFERVLGFNPKTTNKLTSIKKIVIYGTIGNSPILELLDRKKIIDIKQIQNKNEVYQFKVVNNPIDNIEQAIIIAGSDKRGTIYGLFHLSELLGVSPLVDWADVVPQKKEQFTLSDADNLISKEPSVKYRGFFINDEWPAFGTWAKTHFGGFTSKMYEHVFELLLRMKGNYLWPAMWASRFSVDGPGLKNAELADELGVVMGCSHHEPCCRHGEEYKHLRGKDSPYGDAWNFITNKKGITQFWTDGLKRSGKFENVITVGMRGEQDSTILSANSTLQDNINLLKDVLQTQNKLIKEYVNEDLDKVPRMLALYKEVEPYFYGDEKTKGLINNKELDGVTLMLCDDNFGNLRTLPNKEMQNHKGGYGMYYHFDYHGSPFSYEWINTTHISKVYEQMTMAYEFGIRDLWIVNVGDIATTEFPLSFFLDLAYDIEKFTSMKNFSPIEYTLNWTKQQFPTLSVKIQNEISELLNSYTHIAHMRRTEALTSETYHPQNYCESQIMYSKAQELIHKAEKLKEKIDKDNLSPYISQVYYPVIGNMNVLCMQLLAGKNHWYAKHGMMIANSMEEKINACIQKDKDIINEYHEVGNKKWFGMGLSEHIGFKNWNEEENQYPIIMKVTPSNKNRISVFIEGNEETTSGFTWTRKQLTIDAFKNPQITETKFFIALNSSTPVSYKIKNNASWLSLSKEKGKVKELDEIIVKIDREKLLKQDNYSALIEIECEKSGLLKTYIPIKVDATQPDIKKYPKGTYIETSDYISIEAEHYSKNVRTKSGEYVTLLEYGKTLSAIKVIPTNSFFDVNDKNAPYIEYSFVPNKQGEYSFDFYANSSNPVSNENKLQFAFKLNNEEAQIIDVIPEDYKVGDHMVMWSKNVTDNIRITSASSSVKKGLNKLRISPITPGFVLEKIVIYSTKTKILDSYLGPAESFRIE